MNQLILNICVITVAIALYKMLVPDGAFTKQIGFLVTCFFIAGIAGYFGGANGLIHADTLKQAFSDGASYVDFSAQLTENRKRAIADELSARVRETLESNNISCEKIYVIVNISGLYGISISEIELVLPVGEEENEQAAADLAQRTVGPTIAVSVVTMKAMEQTPADTAEAGAGMVNIPEIDYVD
jgi:hypothetical protein